MEKTIRVGMMPGKIQEVAVEVGTSIQEVLDIAELNATGYDVKVDGEKYTDLSESVTENTSLILLAKQVKGNAGGTVRIGMMPGKINEYAVEEGTSIREALTIAELNATGYDVKVDGEKVQDLDGTIINSETNLILLAKQVKGNAESLIRIGMMPGKINEYAVNSNASFLDAINLAELDATGYDVKADGEKITELDAPVGETKLILLAKQVKGN